jgi:hypothetical protein
MALSSKRLHATDIVIRCQIELATSIEPRRNIITKTRRTNGNSGRNNPSGCPKMILALDQTYATSQRLHSV